MTIGPRTDQDLVILTGIEPGETVVTDGQLRLQPVGSTIVTTGGGSRRGGGGGGRKALDGAQSDLRVRGSLVQVNLSEIFIRRPIATSLLMAAIALFGVVAYRTLPVSDLPSVDFPTLTSRPTCRVRIRPPWLLR